MISGGLVLTIPIKLIIMAFWCQLNEHCNKGNCNKTKNLEVHLFVTITNKQPTNIFLCKTKMLPAFILWKCNYSLLWPSFTFFFPIFSIFHNKENFLLYFIELIGSILFDYCWCTIPSVCVFAKYLFKLITKKKSSIVIYTF